MLVLHHLIKCRLKIEWKGILQNGVQNMIPKCFVHDMMLSVCIYTA